MTRQNLIIKWSVYTLVLIPVWIAQVYVFSRWTLWGAAPLLFPLSVAAVGTMEQPRAASVYGICVGVFWYTLTGCPPLFILVCALAGMSASLASQNGFTRRFLTYLLVCLPILAVFELTQMLPLLFLRSASAGACFLLGARELAVSYPFSLLVYPLTLLAFRKVGRDALA